MQSSVNLSCTVQDCNIVLYYNLLLYCAVLYCKNVLYCKAMNYVWELARPRITAAPQGDVVLFVSDTEWISSGWLRNQHCKNKWRSNIFSCVKLCSVSWWNKEFLKVMKPRGKWGWINMFLFFNKLVYIQTNYDV